MCEKYDVSGYPTLKYFSKDTATEGAEYEGERNYNKLKQFVEDMSKPPCIVATLEHCNQEEKDFIQESKGWDRGKMAEEKTKYEAEIQAAKTKHKELADLFEKQKEEAMNTSKLEDEAKDEVNKVTKDIKFKVNLLAQKVGIKMDL